MEGGWRNPPPSESGEWNIVTFKSIAIIGLGTLGGFVAEAVSNLDQVESLVIIDHDRVERKNLTNSIYRNIDVGAAKTDALVEIIKHRNPDKTIISFKEMYIENKIQIPKCDVVFDCRDYTYDRGKIIDARLYISSRYLIVDARKNVIYKSPQEGKYLEMLTKDDLRYASSIISMLISTGTISNLMKYQSVQKYELDYVKHLENKCDVIYDNEDGKFVNLPQQIHPIIESNKRSDVQVIMGNRATPISQRTIPMNKLKSSKDIIENLMYVSQAMCGFNHFVISTYREGEMFYIELIPETGAA
jgi:hypothetical protein